MKIKFLGTSAGWPLPRLGCNCEICSSKDPKDTRTRTQVLVNDSILIDVGPHTYDHLKNIDATKIHSVLISHEHPDHTLGFWDLTHIYNRYQTITVYITKPLIATINRLLGPHRKNIKVKVVGVNEPFQIDHVKVEYFPVIHGKTPAFGIKLKENKIFVYITDFNRILPSQEKIVKHCDVLAIDGSTLGKLGQGPGHISIQDGIIISQNLKARSVYFIHIGHKTGTHQFLEEYLTKHAGPNFHAAFDGLELNI